MKKTPKAILALLLALSLAALPLSGCKREEEQQPDDPGAASSRVEVEDPTPGSWEDGGVNTAGHWLKKLSAPQQLLMGESEIAGYNAQIVANAATRCVDLANYPESLGGDELKNLLGETGRPAEERYNGSELATDAYYAALENNLALSAVKDQNAVRYAFVTRETVLRAFPTADPSYEFADDVEFDLFAETSLRVFEPVVVLHTSADGKWYFIQSYNYRGWAPADSLALAASRSEWSGYLDPAQKLVVTGNRLRLGVNPYEEQLSELELTMGTVLPLVSQADKPGEIDRVSTESGRVVLLPTRQEDGSLQVQQAIIPWNADVSEGYLPYTQENILLQAFKLLGDRHGWSGTLSSRDASSLVMDVYQCFGLHLPRNSSQQALLSGEGPSLDGLGEEEKREALLSAAPGSLLSMDGYTGIYLGEENGEPYALHSLFVVYDVGGNERIINAAVVSDLTLCTDSGESYLGQMKSVKALK